MIILIDTIGLYTYILNTFDIILIAALDNTTQIVKSNQNNLYRFIV